MAKQKPPQSSSDRVLNRKKDAALQAELQSEQLDTDASDEGADDEGGTKRLSEKDLAKRKKIFKFGLMGIGATLFIWLLFWLFKPYQGPLTFGVCKVFLEQNVQYPQTLRLSQVEEINDFIRIWYAQTDGFGEYRMDNIRCTFEADDQIGFRLKKVSFNRRDVDPDKVDAFNRSLPVVFAYPPDLTYPRRIPDSLKDLQLNVDAFFKIRLTP